MFLYQEFVANNAQWCSALSYNVFSNFPPAVLGSLSINDETPTISTTQVAANGLGPSSEPRPAASFLKVTELDSTSPLNTSHMEVPQ